MKAYKKDQGRHARMTAFWALALLLLFGCTTLHRFLVTQWTTSLGGAEMCMPGDNVKLEVELITPIAMDEQLRFAIREGGRTVGAGVVTKILK